MLTAGTLTALHHVTTAAGREGRTNACVAHAAKTAKSTAWSAKLSVAKPAAECAWTLFRCWTQRMTE